MKRRHFLSATTLALLPVTGAATTATTAAKRTPSQTEGPYYPVTPIRHNNDLVINAHSMKGKPMHLTGHVLDADGRPLPGVKIEIWQCDGAGIYDHPAQRNFARFDQSFAGSGAHVTDAEGAYAFRAMYPVPYTARPPHIHVKLWRNQRTALTSQLYLHGNTGSEWFGNKRAYLQIAPLPDARGQLTAQFTFVI
ncbi:MAG: protocatechuate 3,4-dioxygenase [Gammaproteobacteria bacterium]